MPGLASLVLCSAAVFAYEGRLDVSPINPPVSTSSAILRDESNREIRVSAPWITARFTVTNQGAQEIFGEGLDVEVFSADGGEARYRVSRELRIRPGQTIDIPATYFGNLPPSKTSDYSVTARLIGRLGSSGPPVDLSVTFMTK